MKVEAHKFQVHVSYHVFQRYIRRNVSTVYPLCRQSRCPVSTVPAADFSRLSLSAVPLVAPTLPLLSVAVAAATGPSRLITRPSISAVAAAARNRCMNSKQSAGGGRRPEPLSPSTDEPNKRPAAASSADYEPSRYRRMQRYWPQGLCHHVN